MNTVSSILVKGCVLILSGCSVPDKWLDLGYYGHGYVVDRFSHTGENYVSCATHYYNDSLKTTNNIPVKTTKPFQGNRVLPRHQGPPEILPTYTGNKS